MKTDYKNKVVDNLCEIRDYIFNGGVDNFEKRLDYVAAINQALMYIKSN